MRTIKSSTPTHPLVQQITPIKKVALDISANDTAIKQLASGTVLENQLEVESTENTRSAENPVEHKDPNFWDRTQFLGGSDVGAILGLSSFRSAVDVWLEKT